MKRRSFYFVLVIELAALTGLVLFANRLPDVFSSVPAFPFEQIGLALRALSGAGRIGNGLAAAIVAGASVLPILIALSNWRRSGRAAESAALCLMGISLGAVLVLMTNPAWLMKLFPQSELSFLPVAKGALGCVFWSIAVMWLVFRLTRLFHAGDTRGLMGYLRVSLWWLCLLFCAVIPLSCLKTLVTDLSKGGGADGVFAVMRFIAAAAPYVLDIAVTIALIALFDAYAEEDAALTAKCAARLSRLCAAALGISAALSAAVNIAQLMFARFINNISVNVELPLVSIAFMLMILLLTRLITENLRLKSDNDLFI